MTIINSNYKDDGSAYKNPLMLGSSGGSGHISAILGIYQYLKHKFKDSIHFTWHEPTYSVSHYERSPIKQVLKVTKIMDMNLFKQPLENLTKFLGLPLLPNYNALEKEIRDLFEKEETVGARIYIDLLLDVHSDGHVIVPIWNFLQRTEQTAALNKLIPFQGLDNSTHYNEIHDYFLKTLVRAERQNRPYTEVISTQAMGLPAICDAIQDYNEHLILINSPLPPLKIHQYMTDLPTKGAVHFFNSLATLKPKQQQLMHLYAVNMNEEVLTHFFPNGNHFAGIYNVAPKDNPMVRPGFTNPVYDNSQYFHENVLIQLNEAKPITIKADEKIASIMLGSQASNDTIQYVDSLLKTGIEKVFVFGGKNSNLSHEINKLITANHSYQSKIIPLAAQNDEQITSLLTRSNIVVVRGGGLSVMEEMALPHNPEQTLLFHHHNESNNHLTSGMIWEDENINDLISYLSSKNIYAAKTSPTLALRHLYEAELIQYLHKENIFKDFDVLTEQIHHLSNFTLQQCVNWIRQKEFDRLKAYFNAFTVNGRHERNNFVSLEILLNECLKCQNYLAQIMKEELDQMDNLSSYLKVENKQILLDQYDLQKVAKDINSEKFQNASSKLRSVAITYAAVSQLTDTIKPTTCGTVSSKLLNFLNTYHDPCIKKSLGSYQDSKILKFIHEITYQLAKIFKFNHYFDSFLKPPLRLRKQVDVYTMKNLNRFV